MGVESDSFVAFHFERILKISYLEEGRKVDVLLEQKVNIDKHG